MSDPNAAAFDASSADQRTGPIPINLIPLDATPASIAGAVDYAYRLGLGYRSKIETWMRRPVVGLSVLEVGPGPDFGAALVLQAFGARVAIADRWVTPWQSAYHGPFYRALADRLETEMPEADVAPLRALVAADGYLPNVIEQYQDASILAGAMPESFDLVVSNAVFEHVLDHRLTAERLFAATKRGGFNFHQVDFRDHRDFSRPLEFLLLTAAELQSFMAVTDTHEGNPRRPSEYEAAFQEVGFEMLRAWVTERTDADYLQAFLPKLRAREGSPYQSASLADLEIGGISYVLRKPDEEATS